MSSVTSAHQLYSELNQNLSRCFYCHKLGHLIAVCPVLREKELLSNKNASSIGPIQCPSTVDHHRPVPAIEPAVELDEVFKPFISKGFLSLTGREGDKVPSQF